MDDPTKDRETYRAGGYANERAFIAEPECRGLIGYGMQDYVEKRRQGFSPSAARATADANLGRRTSDRQAHHQEATEAIQNFLDKPDTETEENLWSH